MTQGFVENIRGLYEQNCEGISPLQKAIRDQAWKRFSDLGLPQKNLPGYQYFPLSQFYQEAYELPSLPDISTDQYYPLIYPECRSSYLIFVNGQYVPELSNTTALPEEVVVMRLKDALNKHGNFLQMRLSRSLKEEVDPFVTLNIAMVQMGLFLYIPQGVHVETPIQCLDLICNEKSAFFNPRIHFFMGKGAQAQFTYDHVCLKDFDYFSNGVIDVALEEGAKLEQSSVLNPCAHGYCLTSVRATLKRDSTFNSLTCGSASRSLKQDFRISLAGENASCDLKGISLLSENRQSHVNVHVEHAAPHCHSNQLFKNVVNDNGKASFEGKIYVHSKAQKTEAYQLNNNLLLGQRAISNSKPNLEIFADDVKASHGATVTQLNPEHLHYLRSRGVDPETARQLLLRGFILDVIDEAPCDAIRQRMLHVAEKHTS